ncbi:MAG: 50S ribosomal protein L35 [Candidatus Absconditabacterales bacterium]|nr:50S ribosomal protein L35 [Candidatus Absconditabacterales bacterium]
MAISKNRLKTNKSSAKRFKVTAHGYSRRKGGLNHRVTGKGKAPRVKKYGIFITTAFAKKLKQLLPGT